MLSNDGGERLPNSEEPGCSSCVNTWVYLSNSEEIRTNLVLIWIDRRGFESAWLRVNDLIDGGLLHDDQGGCYLICSLSSHVLLEERLHAPPYVLRGVAPWISYRRFAGYGVRADQVMAKSDITGASDCCAFR